jgi:hypothetical protein
VPALKFEKIQQFNSTDLDPNTSIAEWRMGIPQSRGGGDENFVGNLLRVEFPQLEHPYSHHHSPPFLSGYPVKHQSETHNGLIASDPTEFVI